jgi:hypothetical protein
LTKIYNLELQFNRSYQIITFSTPNFKLVFQDLVPVLSLRQKSVRFRFSTGTKSSKTAQKTLKKNVKMYLVPATSP